MKKIEFISAKKDIEKIIDPPKPAINFIPEWYKKSSLYITDDKIPIHYDGGFNTTIKQCMPVFDTLLSGYVFGTASDLFFLNEEKYNGIRVTSAHFSETVIINDHSTAQLQKYPNPDQYDQIFKWNFWWKIKTPPGYSCLITHPRHRFDLPFITLDAIVDTDTYNGVILFPFLLNKNFTGKLDKGTPIVQIFPFKREEWKSSYLEFDEQISIDSKKNFSYIGGLYKKTFWRRKVYR